MAATFFHGGTICSGAAQGDSSALLIRDGLVVALGAEAANIVGTLADLETVDLDGGFVMPSFGDGHAHPLFGGLEAEGPAVRACGSIPRDRRRGRTVRRSASEGGVDLRGLV